MADLLHTSEPRRSSLVEALESQSWWPDLCRLVLLTFACNTTLWAQLQFFGSHVGSEHLEVACGTGTFLKLELWWRRRRKLRNGRITAVEASESQVAVAQRTFASQGNLTFLHGNSVNLPFGESTFRTINIAIGLQGLPDALGALREAHRVLKPGGTLACCAQLHPSGPFRVIAEKVNAWGTRMGILYATFRAEDVRAALKRAGFSIQSFMIRGNCLEIMVRKPAPGR